MWILKTSYGKSEQNGEKNFFAVKWSDAQTQTKSGRLKLLRSIVLMMFISQKWNKSGSFSQTKFLALF